MKTVEWIDLQKQFIEMLKKENWFLRKKLREYIGYEVGEEKGF